jgi:peptidoglycan/LPS O-acetylase OafA/YrhL
MRLLPLAFTVLLFSLVMMILFLPETVWNMNVRQLLGSLFYIENWILAADSVDYMAADNEPSLVQHYWSLSIEEQFYVLLPIIFVAFYFLAQRLGRQYKHHDSARIVITWSLVGVIAASFLFSVWFTNYDAAQAYFVTPTRFWEFAAGGLLAMLPLSSMPDRLQNLLGWSGITMIVVASVIYTGQTPFPGYTALLPVVGASLFIRFGSRQPFAGVYWWASRTPAIRMGDWSYAIYLWHWPLIIIATYQLDEFKWQYKLVVVILTFALSATSQRLIEDPLRRAQRFKIPPRAFGLMGANMAAIAAITFMLPQLLSTPTQEHVTVSDCIGADALLDNCKDPGTDGEPMIPATQVQIEAEEPEYTECIVPAGYGDLDQSDCELGAAKESAELTIAVLGDSHARAWLPMLDEVGQKNNWHIRGYTKSGCTPVPLSSAGPDVDQTQKEESAACMEFVRDAAEEFKSDEVDVVITAASPIDRNFYLKSGDTSKTIAANALHTMWDGWEAVGTEVVVIGEVPHFEELEGPTCVLSNQDDLVEECSKPAREVIDGRQAILRATASNSDAGIDFYDPVPGICDDRRCYSMVGHLITRYDHHHLSSDFARSFGEDFVDFMAEEVTTGS